MGEADGRPGEALSLRRCASCDGSTGYRASVQNERSVSKRKAPAGLRLGAVVAQASVDLLTVSLSLKRAPVLVTGQAGTSGQAEITSTYTQTGTQGIIAEGDALIGGGAEVPASFAERPELSVPAVYDLTHLAAGQSFPLLQFGR